MTTIAALRFLKAEYEARTVALVREARQVGMFESAGGDAAARAGRAAEVARELARLLDEEGSP